MMKKNMYTMLGAMLLAGTFAFSAAAVEAGDVEGMWYLTTMEWDGTEVNVASMGYEMTIDLAADGTCVIAASYEDDISASWSVDGDTILISDADDGSDPLEVTYVDGALTMTEDDTTMNFGREPLEAEVQEVGAVIEAPALEDFDGTWAATNIVMFGSEIPVSAAGIEMSVTIANGEATVYFNDGEEELEKTLVGTLEGDTLLLKNPEDPEDMEVYFDTDTMNLRLHDNGIMSYADEDFFDEEPETEAAEEAEDETEDNPFADVDTSFALYFEKQ